MSIYETLKHGPNAMGDADSYLDLDEIKSKYTSVEQLDDAPGHWLAIYSKPDSSWLEYALFAFGSSNIDDTDVKVKKVFNGEGPSGSLREMRHTYFGDEDDGYVFYLPLDATIEALKRLKAYYD